MRGHTTGDGVSGFYLGSGDPDDTEGGEGGDGGSHGAHAHGGEFGALYRGDGESPGRAQRGAENGDGPGWWED